MRIRSPSRAFFLATIQLVLASTLLVAQDHFVPDCPPPFSTALGSHQVD
jgi:hypothetical protein